MRMFWPERVGGKILIGTSKVGACEYISAFHTAIFHPAGAGRHGVFAMIDPKDNIKKLIVFYHETKVSSEQPPGHKFTSRGIIFTDHTFSTSDAADAHFDQFKNNTLPSYNPILDPEAISSIQDHPIDVAIDMERIVKAMRLYKNTTTKEELKLRHGEQLFLEDKSTQVFEHAKEIAGKHNQLLIVKGLYHRYLNSEMLSEDEL